MTNTQFIRFARDFEIIPGLLSASDVVTAARDSNSSLKSVSESEHLFYPEWLEAIGRMAVAIFSKYVPCHTCMVLI